MSTKHTPTPRPWKVAGAARSTVWAVGPQIVADCYGIPGFDTSYPVIAERDANAALIVRAVNAHEALLDVLNVLRKIVAYRNRVGPLGFQLEKMDIYLQAGRAAIDAATKGEGV